VVPTAGDVNRSTATFGLVGATAATTGISSVRSGSNLAGAITVTPAGGTGTVVEVRLQALASYVVVGSHGVVETCTPERPVVIARVAVGVPQVSVGDAAVVEGASGTRALAFPVTLSRPSPTPVTVGFATEDGAATAGPDFVAAAGSVTIPAGAVTKVVTVRVRGDAAVEPKEHLRVRLVDPVGAVVGRGRGTGRIVDDDPEPGPRLSIGDSAVVEGARGTRSARFTVSLSGPATERVTFHWAVRDGTAIAGVDLRPYGGAAGLDGFVDVGRVSTTVPVPVLADTAGEGDETFTVRLSAVTGATLGRTNGVGRILDDD
jgi:chitinase